MTLANTIAFVGDIHLQFNNPASRTDNYFMTILGKIEQIMKKNKYIVSLGDIFSNPVLDTQAIIILIQLLQKYKDRGGEFYEIAGNHTIYSWQLKTINKTTLGLLHKLGLIKILDRSGNVEGAIPKLEIDSYTIIPGLLNEPKNILVPEGDNNILVAHAYYEFERDKKHSLEFKDLEESNYKFIFLGHDHEPYKSKIVGKSILYRPGSLAREAAHSYNFTRGINYYQLDLDIGEVKLVKVEAAPAEEVFSVEAVEKHNDVTPKYVYDMEELMKSFKSKKTMNISIKKMLEDNPAIPDRIVEFIKDCYEANNIQFV